MQQIIPQSVKNTLITYTGFILGGINTLFLFTFLLTKEQYGLVSLVLSVANLLMPLLSMGVQDTLVRFYFHTQTLQEQKHLVNLALLLPLVAVGIVGGGLFLKEDFFSVWLSKENPQVGAFIWQIFILAVLMAYFEVFCAWAKVHFNTSQGVFLREVYPRGLSMLLLSGIYTEIICFSYFIPFLLLGYLCRMLLMAVIAYRIAPFGFSFSLPKNTTQILRYAGVLVLSTGVSALLIDIDKFMLNQYLPLSQIAVYSVAVYMASVVAVPQRAMYQIIRPTVAELMSQNNKVAIAKLFEQTSQGVVGVSTVACLLVVCNATEFYALMPSKGYEAGFGVLCFIAAVKLTDGFTCLSNAILFNASYYQNALYLGLLLVVTMVSLNTVFIPQMGIEGAAIASLVAFLLYNTLKICTVYYHEGLQPFSWQIAVMLICTAFLFTINYCIKIPFAPLVNIFIRSLIIITTSLLLMKFLFPNYYKKLKTKILSLY